MLSKIKQLLMKLAFPMWTVPLVLLGLGFIAYGFLIPSWGFYWDDWAKTLVNHLYGYSGYWDYYAYDRPLSGWTHIVLLPILGEEPLNWQIFTFTMRWISGVAMWYSLSILWPQAKRSLILAALLFMVYPVFRQQPIAVTFHQMWLQYVLYFLSLGAMFLSIRKPHRYWHYMIPAVIMQFMINSITEYFIGVELLRPLFLWFIISQAEGSTSIRIRKTLRHYLPYALMLSAYLIWRLFFMKLVVEDPYQVVLFNNFLASPFASIKNYLSLGLLESFYILLANWASLLDINSFRDPTPFTIFSWGLALLSTTALAFYLVHLKQDSIVGKTRGTPGSQTANLWVLEAVIVGLLSIPLGALPSWLIGRGVLNDVHADRYAVVAMFGASLLMITFLEWISKEWNKKAIILSLLVGLSLTMHLRSGNDFRWLWTYQTRFYWQLLWRAPYLQPQTAILFEDEPFLDQGLFSTSSAINFLYPQDENPEHLAYWVYTLRPRFTYLESRPEVIPLNTNFRSLSFVGEAPDSIFAHYDRAKGNCWWFLDEKDTGNPDLPELTTEWLYLSNLDRIDENPKSADYQPESIIGAEPPHNWCYYYQKAALALQFSDWEQIVDLGYEAEEKGYFPGNSSSKSPHEWLPFIEGYANRGLWDKAASLTIRSSEASNNYDPALCSLWDKIASNTNGADEKQSIVAEMTEKLHCSSLNPPTTDQ
jgi:hypothetical protein